MVHFLLGHPVYTTNYLMLKIKNNRKTANRKQYNHQARLRTVLLTIFEHWSSVFKFHRQHWLKLNCSCL